MDDNKTIKNLTIMVGMLAALGIAIFFVADMVSGISV